MKEDKKKKIYCIHKYLSVTVPNRSQYIGTKERTTLKSIELNTKCNSNH